MGSNEISEPAQVDELGTNPCQELFITQQGYFLDSTRSLIREIYADVLASDDAPSSMETLRQCGICASKPYSRTNILKSIALSRIRNWVDFEDKDLVQHYVRKRRLFINNAMAETYGGDGPVFMHVAVISKLPSDYFDRALCACDFERVCIALADQLCDMRLLMLSASHLMQCFKTVDEWAALQLPGAMKAIVLDDFQKQCVQKSAAVLVAEITRCLNGGTNWSAQTFSDINGLRSFLWSFAQLAGVEIDASLEHAPPVHYEGMVKNFGWCYFFGGFQEALFLTVDRVPLGYERVQQTLEDHSELPRFCSRIMGAFGRFVDEGKIVL